MTELIVQLIEYTKHEEGCILAYPMDHRPTADGGYEVCYRDMWYQTMPVNECPKCECGLDDLIHELIEESMK